MTQANPSRSPDWRRRLVFLFLLVSAVVVCDQLTKLWIVANLRPGESVPIIPGLVHFTLVRNTGMAFGLFSDSDVPYKSLLVTLASLVALGVVAYYALRSPQTERASTAGLGLIIGGAVGNIVDRARLGYVIDFVDAFYRDAHWPAFNVADSCICVGVGLLLLDSLRSREPAMPSERNVAAGATRGDS